MDIRRGSGIDGRDCLRWASWSRSPRNRRAAPLLRRGPRCPSRSVLVSMNGYSQRVRNRWKRLSPLGVLVSLTTKPQSSAAAETWASLSESVRACLHEWIFAEGPESMEEAVSVGRLGLAHHETAEQRRC